MHEFKTLTVPRFLGQGSGGQKLGNQLYKILSEIDSELSEGGQKGDSATVEVDSTDTVDAGEDAEVTNDGDKHSAKLVFKIPKGDKGDTGDDGSDGSDGDKGDTGDDGSDGSDGDKGDTGRGVDDIEYDSDEDELVFKMTEGDDIRIPWPDRDES